MRAKPLLSLFIIAFFSTIMAQGSTHLYRGRSSYSSDILYTWDGRYIYRGRSTYSSDILCTYDGRYLYRGNSTYSSDILYTTDAILPVPLLIAITM